MCGIAGFITPDKTISSYEGLDKIQHMTVQLEHRGPDADGQWCDAEQGIFLGHTRLSILDLSPAGAQPMQSQCGQYVISFNGEIYNALDLKSDLQKIAFKGHSDTEVLLEYVSAFGFERTLQKIKGMFAIALWDKKRRTLHLAVDHLGKKPLYVGHVGGYIGFASELKALRTLSHEKPPIDQKALNIYKYFGFIPAPYSIYEGIYKLLPGHTLTLGEGDDLRKQMKPYWELDTEAKRTPYDEAELKDLLSRAVGQRMISDVPLGCFLSGGIDSSLVSALMQEQSTQPIKTYSIGFEEAQFDESQYAEPIAAHLGTDHKTYFVTADETQSIIPDLPSIYDEPFADYSQIPTAILCQHARKDTTVALSGDGGDEVFCGYKRYFMLKKLLEFSGKFPKTVRNLASIALRTPGQNIYKAAGLNGKQIHSIAGYLVEPDLPSAIFRTLSMNPDMSNPPSYSDFAFKGYDGLSDLEEMMAVDTSLYLPADILVKVDRASMFSSLEVRSPLLDKDILEYAWRTPIEDKIFAHEGRGKRPLYELLNKYVPKDLIDRPKQGFSPPVGVWLKSSLRGWAEDLLFSDTGLYDPAETRRLWTDFQAGKADYHKEIWCILMAQSWYVNSYEMK